jgi:hypothetical protein
MDVSAAIREWAERHFGTAQLGDRRRTRRLVESAARIAARPAAAFPEVFDWDGLRGFYNLCHRREVTLNSVQEPHRLDTRAAMGREPLVLILHDTTELDYTTHAALAGAGPVGDGGGRGFRQHNSLAVAPSPRRVLGLVHQQLHVRAPAPAGERTPHRKRRARESGLWLAGIGAAGEPPPGCTWVDVADRGCDVYEAMCAARAAGHHFLFRLAQNREVFTDPAHGQLGLVLDHARGLPSRGTDAVDIPARGGRPARAASVCLASAPVWVPAPRETPGRRQQPVIEAWVIRVWESEPPPGSEPLEWLLLCSVPTDAVEELKERRDWYCCRWLIEVYHDVLKNGCREESRRFETAARMGACLAVLSVVAVRVLQLRTALEREP